MQKFLHTISFTGMVPSQKLIVTFLYGKTSNNIPNNIYCLKPQKHYYRTTAEKNLAHLGIWTEISCC